MRKKIKIFIIGGTRPNFIKIAPLMEEIKKHKQIKPVLVHTGQHYNFRMSKLFFQELKIPKPDYNLGVGSGSHSWQTAKIMEKAEPVILKEKPNLVIVVGDVNSTLAGALTAAKLNIPVAHIEAGLRSYDKTMPEEINRTLTDHVSDFLFCPTKTAVENLKKEGIRKGIYNVGDITYDAFLKNIKIAGKTPRKHNGLFSDSEEILEKLKLKNYLLLTLHRPSNTDNLKNLKKILEAINKNREKIIFPVHPRTEKQLKKIEIRNLKLKIIPPVSFLNMLRLEKNAKKIITDSGGIQKEAYWLKIPCITLRDTTEWVETVKSGWNILVGNDEKKIINTIKKFNPQHRKHYNYFGNGKTAQKIIRVLIKNLKV